MSFRRNKVDQLKVGELLSILVHRRTIVDSMSLRRTKVDPLKVGELLSILVYRRTIVDPMSFGRTKVYPLKVGKLLLILQCIACMNLFERKLYLIQKSLEFT